MYQGAGRCVKSAAGSLVWETVRVLRRPAPINSQSDRSTTMSKRARKRRSRKGNAANHGRKPNA
jgi:hypothetical protein